MKLSTANITIDELLQTTSRTFALSIPLLPAPMDRRITLAYLLFRIADTLEDADHLSCSKRQNGLRSLCGLLEDVDDEAAIQQWTKDWTQDAISKDENYNRLMRETPQVLRALANLDPPSVQCIIDHAQRSADGMASVLEQTSETGQLRLASLQDLRTYCYFVAGIVGELITDLFIIESEQLGQSAALREHGVAFGEGLQLVNILKDSQADLQCGRSYLPQNTCLDEVFELAFDDLRRANVYVEALRELSAPPGYIAFCDAPVQLAHATLREVKEHGPGSKVGRAETMHLLQEVLQRSGLTNWGDE